MIFASVCFVGKPTKCCFQTHFRTSAPRLWHVPRGAHTAWLAGGLLLRVCTLGWGCRPELGREPLVRLGTRAHKSWLQPRSGEKAIAVVRKEN